MIRLGQSHLPVIRLPQFSPAETRAIGNYAIAVERSRLNRGVNLKDQPAKALNPAYRRQKIRAGASPIRNEFLTGANQAARTVIWADGSMVQIGFSDSRFYERAAVSQKAEPMWGNSNEDIRKVTRFVMRLRDAALRRTLQMAA